jgi:hypothetical protein
LTKNECLLWENAKKLGKEKGLDVENEMRQCAAINICKEGTFCIYLSPTGDFGPQQIEHFKARQEKTDELKLRELRRELKNL